MLKQVFILFISLQFVKAQTPNLDCITALQASSGFSMPILPNTGNGNINDLQAPSNISNPQTNVTGTNSGCMLTGENVPTWFIFKICNTGTFELLFGSNLNLFPQAGYNDWAMWKYTSTTCSKIFNNQLSPLRCNWNAVSGGGTGICGTLNLPSGGSVGNYEPPLAVNAGDSLVLCFSNYSGVNYFIDFLSVGTSSINNCPILTSIIKNDLSKQKVLYYNNTLNQINILDQTITRIILHNAEGKEIYHSEAGQSSYIDCNNFAKGVYFISYFRQDNLPVTEKILIQ